MTSVPPALFALSLEQAARRLDDVHIVPAAPDGGPPLPLRIALPAGYARARRRYPLLLLIGGSACFGGAVEMSRLMAQARELRECIVADIEGLAEGLWGARHPLQVLHEALQYCRRQYRVSAEDCALYGEGVGASCAIQALIAGIPGVSDVIAVAPEPDAAFEASSWPRADAAIQSRRSRRLILLDEPPDRSAAWNEALGRAAASSAPIALIPLRRHGTSAWGLPDLLTGLSALWGLPPRKMYKFDLLGQSWLWPLLHALAPLLRRKLPAAGESGVHNPHLLRSAALGRDFELFVSLPKSCSESGHRRYPALVVLDANLQFSTAAEAVAALSAAGAMAEAIVIGVGTPRSEGFQELAFRRFEELSPPADGYAYDDPLGRIFRGLFALRGQDARQRLGQAPLFHQFLCEQVLPQLQQRYPIDAGRIALVGHSAGGTFACFSLFEPRSPFCGYAAISPGIGMSGHWLQRRLDQGGPIAPSAQAILLTVGAEEEKDPGQASGIHLTARFAEQLREAGGLEVRFQRVDDEAHASTFPRALAEALRVLFGPGTQAAVEP